MKKYILPAIAGALAMLAAMIIAANVSAAKKKVPEDYELPLIQYFASRNAFFSLLSSEMFTIL